MIKRNNFNSELIHEWIFMNLLGVLYDVNIIYQKVLDRNYGGLIKELSQIIYSLLGL